MWPTLQYSNQINRKKIIIVGAGIFGLLTAIALKKQFKDKIDVSIYEKTNQIQNIGGGFILLPNAVMELQSFGLQHIIDALKVDINSASNYSAEDNTIFCGDLSGFYKQTGGFFLTVDRSQFQNLLIDEVKNLNINIYLGHECIDVKESDTLALIQFKCSESKQCIQEIADLVIGADGAKSKVREILQPDAKLEYTQYCVWGGILSTEHKVNVYPNEIRMQYFPKMAVWTAPLCGDRQCFYIFHLMPENEFIDNPRGQKLAQLREKLKNHKSTIVQKILAAPENEHTFAVVARDLKHVKNWCNKGRIILGGDAAHASGPTEGLNTSVAIFDVSILVACLLKHQLNFVTATKDYEQIRMHFAAHFTKLQRDGEVNTVTADPNIIRERDEHLRGLSSNVDVFKYLADLIQESTTEQQMARSILNQLSGQSELRAKI